MSKLKERRWLSNPAFLVSIILLPIVLVVAIRFFVVHPFDINSGSMSPTLLGGDQVIATKYAYGLGPYSLPFGPHSFLARSAENLPAYGDVVAFTTSTKGSTVYVKRVVGHPGDRIQMKEGILYINGEAAKQKRVQDFVTVDDAGNKQHRAQYRETLPNEVSYNVINLVDQGMLDNTVVYHVPAGELFLLGDNRDNSLDSRMPVQFGRVTVQNLIGRFDFIFFDGASKQPIWKAVGSPRG
ncbi:signal peptidase I [uncultured Roseibium sp.]|uniref:signal peptidase I n=1 Tax=uncultured Roseibium sp. TaxID=1936171 RepID=UPI0032178DA4